MATRQLNVRIDERVYALLEGFVASAVAEPGERRPTLASAVELCVVDYLDARKMQADSEDPGGKRRKR